MSWVVHKYTLIIGLNNDFKLPEGAEILSAQSQNDFIQVWALVNTETNRFEHWTFYVVGTGHPLTDDETDSEFLDTVQIGAGVWHVFALKGKK